MAAALGSLVPVDGKPRFSRPKKFRAAIELREADKCAITRVEAECEAAHIMPYAPSALKDATNSPFWFLIGVLFGGQFRLRLWELCGGRLADGPQNGLLLQPTIHEIQHIFLLAVAFFLPSFLLVNSPPAPPVSFLNVVYLLPVILLFCWSAGMSGPMFRRKTRDRE